MAKEGLPVQTACRVLEVSESGLYEWRKTTLGTLTATCLADAADHRGSHRLAWHLRCTAHPRKNSPLVTTAWSSAANPDRARPLVALFRATRCRCLALRPGGCAISGGHVVGACTWRMKMVHCAGDEPFCATTEFPQPRLAGQCYDNAVIETFWGRMQTELLNRKRWKTRIELANALLEYLEIFHNGQRRHSALAMLTPIEFENVHFTHQPVV
ncbi:IS3 family transposase [Rhodococcus globerulus]|uniref:IS3 family transposase n=1 Tax=Rhodococcus globerulus TaxID=33008 RepID=UPI003AFA695F